MSILLLTNPYSIPSPPPSLFDSLFLLLPGVLVVDKCMLYAYATLVRTSSRSCVISLVCARFSSSFLSFNHVKCIAKYAAVL